MKGLLNIPVDSAQADMGIASLIEAHRDLFEQENGRQKIADTMTLLSHKRSRINRQMVEKWFRKGARTLPSSPKLLTLLWACEILKSELKTTTKAA